MDYSNISNQELSIMVENILNGKPVEINSEPQYVDERAEAFIKSLKDMVK